VIWHEAECFSLVICVIVFVCVLLYSLINNTYSFLSNLFSEDDVRAGDEAMVCVHELLLVALVLAWLAVQVLLLIGCCVLIKR
jgi:hypothetical protein